MYIQWKLLIWTRPALNYAVFVAGVYTPVLAKRVSAIARPRMQPRAADVNDVKMPPHSLRLNASSSTVATALGPLTAARSARSGRGRALTAALLRERRC